MKDIYIQTEGDIHSSSNEGVLEAYFGACDESCWYEDGMFNRNFRDFSNNVEFENAYLSAVQNATASGSDPHIRWRARTFEFFLKQSLPGTCLELGTAHGFMFYFALSHLRSTGYNFQDSRVMLIDKFTTCAVDTKSGLPTANTAHLYADYSEEVKKRFRSFEFVEVVEGWIPDVLSTVNFSEINFLHLDLNAALTEVRALRNLIPKLVEGGIVLLDDYGFPEFEESQKAHYALSQQMGYEILSMPTGQGLIIF